MEIRAFVTEDVRDALERCGAECKGDYAFTDRIYARKDAPRPLDLGREFVRIRSYSKSGWEHKPFVLVRKTTVWKTDMRETAEVRREEFDSLAAAEAALPADVSCVISYSRLGHHWLCGEVDCHVEEIKHLPLSVELVGEDVAAIRRILERIPVLSLASAPVPQMVLDAQGEASAPADRKGEPVIVYKESPPDADAYMDLFETTGWNKVYKATAAELETALGRSWYCVAAYDSGSLVGFGRVLSDGVLYAMIYDVIVRPTHQHRGIGTAIVTRLVDKCVSEGLRAVQLFAAKNTAPFYHRHGFVERSPDAPGMRLVKPADSQR